MSQAPSGDTDAGPLARSVDPDRGTQEEAGFFGRGPLRIFGALTLPPGTPHAGVVICCPFQAELLKTYRREVLLARSLAGRGFAVQRFHYRGSGNSDGDAFDATFETMREDTAAAAERVSERAGVRRVAFVGTRLGGLIAAAVAGSRPHPSPIALWEPVVDPEVYFREVFRGLFVRDLKEDGGSRGRADPLDELEREGSVDVLGYTITARLRESALGHRLADELGDRPRPILLVGSGRSGELPGEYEALRARWTGQGFAVAGRVMPSREAWWFGKRPVGRREELDRERAFVDLITEWLAEQMPPGKVDP
jgi:alpha/beta superfamily hydrolase